MFPDRASEGAISLRATLNSMVLGEPIVYDAIDLDTGGLSWATGGPKPILVVYIRRGCPGFQWTFFKVLGYFRPVSKE